MKQKIITFLSLTITFLVTAQDQIVTIPDYNFKNALLNHYPEIDKDGNGEIEISEAKSVIGKINCNYKQISDLTGIEYFINIRELYCSGNKLKTIDISKNTYLRFFECFGNKLTNLDVSKNTDLIRLACYNNELTNLNIKSNINLKYLYCEQNQLTDLNTSKNTGLESLYCNDNQLKILDISKNINLKTLLCNKNELITLDVSQNTFLKLFNCKNNQLTSLDVSKNLSLENFYCNENRLTSLDISRNEMLRNFDCSNNQLTKLNVKNGNNTNLLITYLDFRNNNLSCIEVDNDAYSDSKWSGIKDETAFFSENCITPIFDLPTSICQNATAPILNAISNNDIYGIWSPSTIDTSMEGTQDYIFKPNEEGNTYQITISIISAPETPTGEVTQNFTSGQTIADLVVNGTNLVWYSDVELTTTISDTTELVHNTTYYVVSEKETCRSLVLAITVTEATVNISNFDVYGFSYHPNPVNDALHFSSNSKIENITINNLLGQKINTNLNSDNTILDMSDLPSGNYFVKITIDGVSKTIKIIKN